jgi:A/G-specific adenine glycosylase
VTEPGAQFAQQLLTWWDEHGRRDLPWQQNPSPYRVWVSEIMLQQTQVSTVERYYDRFIDAFPDIAALAKASQDEVLHHWSGLGYYSRARNLHKAAQQVVDRHAGVLPATLDELIALPGIGRSTAGAILSLACGQRQPILDGNVKRVLARFYCVEGWGGSTANLKTLWELAEQCTPKKRVANYTQAIMDLGATVCARAKPRCEICPLKGRCEAYSAGLVAAIPAPKPRKARPTRSAVLVMAISDSGDILLEKRPPTGIWGGLWSFPEVDSIEAIDEWCMSRLGTVPANKRAWPDVSHSFSHFEFAMTPVAITFAGNNEPGDEISDQSEERGYPGGIMEADRWLWYNTRSPAGIGLAAPVTRLLQRLDRQTGEQ